MSDANIIEINGIEVNLEDAKARKDIENLSLTIGKDGLLYIKKQDGTLIGTGVSVSSSGTDLSKITMRVNGNTLTLLNNGTQIASVDLPSSINSSEVSKLIKNDVSETTYNTLGTDNKTIIGGINEINLQLKNLANISLAIGADGLLYIKKQDGTLMGTGINISSSGGEGSTDLSKITMRVENNRLILLNNNLQIASVDLPSSINSDEVSNLIGKGVSETTYNTLGTDNKTIIGGINEVKDNQLILVTDDTSMQGISDSKHDTLETNDKSIIGAINELNTKLKNIPFLFSTEQTDDYYKIKYNNIVIATIPLGKGSVTPTPTTKYNITNNLSHATNSNSATSIEENASYNATITANSNYRIKNVTVTMGSTNVTNSVYSNGRINIPNVTGNITITVTTEAVTTTTTYTVINSLTNCSINNTTRIVNENSPYTAIITPREGCVLSTATITMGGVDITSSAYNNGVINIRQVTGDIVITVTAIETTTPVEPPVDPNLDGLLKNRLLVWHDEFDDATLDTTKWRYATHNSGGSEQQAYTVARTENVRLENSKLILEAHKDSYKSGWTWSSGRIDTCGLAGFKYGRLEAKLRYDVVSGAFPAFWTIGTCAYYPTGENVVGVKKSLGTQWAQNGELDMFEGRGTNKIISQGGWYNQDDGKGNQSLVVGEGKNIDANEYHVYAFEWTPTTITAYIDGVETGTKDITNIKSWQRPMYLILNMAVGSVGGYPADDCTSIKMEVDWVRVYAPVGVTAKEEVQSISLTQNNVSFNVGDDPIDVYYTVNPSTAWDNNVNYESSNPNVAEVYGSRIYPKGIGNCKITARATNGVTATINVTVAQNASINSSSITLDKDTLEIYSGTNSTLIATATPPNHTDSILWKSSNDTIATVANGVVTGKNIGNCTITAYSSANSSVKAECSVAVKEAVQLTGHPTSGLTLQLDRNGMSSTSWRNAIDNTQLQWKVATNNSTDIASYMVFNGDSFYWAGANYKDHLTLSGFSNYYDFGESQTVILAGDFTNGVNPILSNKQKLSQNTNTAFIQGNSVSYSNADGTKLGSINAKDGTYNIDGCISLRYNKQTLRVDCDKMAFTDSAVTNMNTTLSSAFSQGTYPALLGNVSTAKIYWKVVLVYNRVLTNTEIETAMKAIKTFLNS